MRGRRGIPAREFFLLLRSPEPNVLAERFGAEAEKYAFAIEVIKKLHEVESTPGFEKFRDRLAEKLSESEASAVISRLMKDGYIEATTMEDMGGTVKAAFRPTEKFFELERSLRSSSPR